MASPSSRIYVRGLPPSLTEEEFRAHFSKRHAVTDAKLFQRRRIGYVGFKTAADALAAVKYHDKTFIRMSRIRVEIAEPYESRKPNHNEQNASATIDNQQDDSNATSRDQHPFKRKREEDDPQLEEFLRVMKPPSKSKNLIEKESPLHYGTGTNKDESESISKKSVPEKPPAPSKHQEKRDTSQKQPPKVQGIVNGPPVEVVAVNDDDVPNDHAKEVETRNITETATTDSDWMRSRTSRLLGLLDDEDEEQEARREQDDTIPHSNDESSESPEASDFKKNENGPARSEDIETRNQKDDQDLNTIRRSSRLFVRNLPYDVDEDSLTEFFGSVGDIQEVHVPYDSTKHSTKGFAYVQYSDAEDAINAFRKLDGSIFQGRLLHVLPAAVKRESKLDEFAISNLPLKKQKQIQRRLDASQSTFNWNSLYMNPDAVISSVADRLGIPKSELLDPTSTDSAVKQAQAETHVITETKNYFEAHGVNLKAFGKRQRSDTIILVKNFHYGTKEDDLRRLFEDYGDIRKILMPASGTIAIVEFSHAPQARAAFSGLAYKKIGSSVLFLEKAPKDIFNSCNSPEDKLTANSIGPRISGSDLLHNANDTEEFSTSTLFVKNLSFTTTNEHFRNTFQALDGLVSARVKLKADGKSAGFGFLEFQSSDKAQAALQAMNGYNLDGHRLEMKASNKGLDAAEERRKADAAKAKKMRKAKIIIKNLPFEASKKDVRNLFKTYGQLRAVRVPKKFDNTTKGFAFAEFTTPKEAESAMDALRHVHFLGRRLNMEFAAGELEDPEKEIEKMQQKVGRQSNSIAMQQLKDTGRKKFNVNGHDEDPLDE